MHRGPLAKKSVMGRRRFGDGLGKREIKSSGSDRWVIGLHSVGEVFRVRARAIKEFWMKEGFQLPEELKLLAEKSNILPKVRSEGELDRLGSGHQGVAVQVSEWPHWSWESFSHSASQSVLLLDGVQDPHNLGALLRTAWLFGFSALFISEHRSSPLTTTAMKVACGGAEHVPVVVDGNLLTTVTRLKKDGFWIFGLGSEGSSNLWKTQFHERTALILGSEFGGIRTPLARSCDEMVYIPQKEIYASFNASVAGGIAMAEVSRQKLFASFSIR
ncbi:MAG: RNA methyltransferase [Bdellovibrionales bacterium]|nr:RNA methyltransferase [Bdellovibrionales bacterium]